MACGANVCVWFVFSLVELWWANTVMDLHDLQCLFFLAQRESNSFLGTFLKELLQNT